MFIEKLRAATKEAHAEVDHLFYPLIQNINSKESYIAILEMMYSYYKPVQEKIESFADKTILADSGSRRKPEWILADIKALQSKEIIAPGLCNNFPSIDNAAAAAGAYYVLEGSTMGGGILVKKIAQQLNITGKNGLRFFNSYGEETINRWRQFVVMLNTYVEEKQPNEEQIITTATDTFIALKNRIKSFIEDGK